MKPVIAEEFARKEIADWAEYFEIEIDEDDIKNTLPSVRRGRVLFDETEEKFTVQLRSPIHLENKESLNSISLREPTAKEIQKASKVKDEMEMSIRLISIVSGHPIGVIERLKQKDLIALSGVMAFFG